MTEAALAQLALRAIAPEPGVAVTSGSVAAACRTQGAALVSTLVPVLGETAVTALLSRAHTLTGRHHGWRWPPARPEDPQAVLAHACAMLEKHSASDATDAAVRFLATVGQLLITFIGESLTLRLLAEAWPSAMTAPPPDR